MPSRRREARAGSGNAKSSQQHLLTCLLTWTLLCPRWTGSRWWHSWQATSLLVSRKEGAEEGEDKRHGSGERGRVSVEGDIDMSGGESERESVVYAAARKRAKGVLRETVAMLLEREGARGKETGGDELIPDKRGGWEHG